MNLTDLKTRIKRELNSPINCVCGFLFTMAVCFGIIAIAILLRDSAIITTAQFDAMGYVAVTVWASGAFWLCMMIYSLGQMLRGFSL